MVGAVDHRNYGGTTAMPVREMLLCLRQCRLGSSQCLSVQKNLLRPFQKAIVPGFPSSAGPGWGLHVSCCPALLGLLSAAS